MPLYKTSDEEPEALQRRGGLPGGTLPWDAVLIATKIEWSLCIGRTSVACFENQGWAAHLQLKAGQTSWRREHGTRAFFSQGLPGRDEVRD